MTLQQLLDQHIPKTVEEADILIKGNYFHQEVTRDSISHGGMFIAHRYTVIHKKLLGIPVRKEVGYINCL